MYSQCIQFVLSLHTRDSICTVAAETQTNRRGIFLLTFSYLNEVFYTTITKTVNLINIPINITENKSIGTVIGAKEVQNTHVFDTTASRAKWRPRRDDDGREMSPEFSCACPVKSIYFR